MGILMEKIALSAVDTPFISVGSYHPLSHFVPGFKKQMFLQTQEMIHGPHYAQLDNVVRTYFNSLFDEGNNIVFDGKTYGAHQILANTPVVMGETLAFLAKMHGYCEIHAYVEEDNREWLAGVIERGRKKNMLRPNMGWEDVMEHLRCGDGGVVATSYSVCDSFPEPEPENYSEDWYELPHEEQWKQGLAAVRKNAEWLELRPDNLEVPCFSTELTLWDLVASPDWRY